MYISHSRESSQAVHTHSHPFTHYSHSRRIVFTAILTLFAHYSHGRTLFARSHTIRTLFARFTNYSRAISTPNSHTIRTSCSSHPDHTIRAVGASPLAVFALIHAVFAQFTPVRICEYGICTLWCSPIDIVTDRGDISQCRHTSQGGAQLQSVHSGETERRNNK